MFSEALSQFARGKQIGYLYCTFEIGTQVYSSHNENR